MRSPSLLLGFGALFTLGCGGGAQSPAATPDTTAHADAPAQKPAAPRGPCLVSLVGKRPSAPVEEVGTITARMSKETCSLEVVPQNGAKSTPACEPKTARDTTRNAACEMGGDVVWMNGTREQIEKSGQAEFKVARFTKPDANADLALICAPFSTLKNPSTGETLDEKSFDPSQKARIRAAVLDETMTSREWRLWLRDMLTDRAAAVAKLKSSVKTAGIDCKAEWVKAE